MSLLKSLSEGPIHQYDSVLNRFIDVGRLFQATVLFSEFDRKKNKLSQDLGLYVPICQCMYVCMYVGR